MRNCRLIAGVALVFFLGVLAGLLPGFYLTHRFPPPPPPPHMDHRDRDAAMLGRLSRDLGLTDAQKDRIGIIMRQTSEKLDQRLRQMQPEIRKIFDDGFSEMEKELTDDQRNKLRDLRERMEKQGRPGPPFP
jgi:Spy/CpxP family protein refolding chaperone